MQWEKILREGFTPPAIGISTSLPDAVTIATDAIAKHLSHSEKVRTYINDLPKGRGTFCPDSPLKEIVKYIAVQKSQVDKKDPALNLAFLNKLVKPVFDFEKEQMLRAISLIDDITTEEMSVFNFSSKFGHLHDRLWAKWFDKIVVPYQSLDEESKEKYEDLTKNQLAQFDYTAFDFSTAKGCVNRQTWAWSFPNEVRDIVDALAEVEKDNPKSAFVEFWSALREAYSCTEISLLESAWAKVDWAWIKIQIESRLIPVHGMESGYEHPFGVSPEFRLEVRTEKARECIDKSRAGTIAHAEAMGLSPKLVTLASQKLSRIDIGVCTCAIRAGVSLNFRIAGQAVPNRQDVLALGGKIFLNESSPRREKEMALEYLNKHCTSETAKALSGYITLEGLLAHTIDHEFSHPVGCTPESDEGIGGEVKKILEEAKATVRGMSADEWRNPTAENRMTLVAETVARVIRFMHTATLENATFAAYVRENFVSATTLFESGVMKLTENGIGVDLEKAQSKVWFEHLNKFGTAVVAAYQAEDKDEIRQLAEQYCNKDGAPIAKLIQWVNRK